MEGSKYKCLNNKFIIVCENLKEVIKEKLIPEFVVNKYLTLRLEGEKTVIYINGERFQQCKFLYLNNIIEVMSTFDDIDSVDESFEKSKPLLKNKNISHKPISPEIEFWGHCSNLQIWTEHKYNTRLLHSKLAFPLLKKLVEAGDPVAIKVFKKEIGKRLKTGFPSVVNFLITEGYVDYLDREELLYINSLKEVKLTLFLVLINSFIFILLNLFLPQELFILFIQINQNIIKRLEIWRLFTSIFLHINAGHLILNMILLMVFGTSIETNQNFSKYEYLIIYFLSGIIGNFSFLILLPMNSTGLGSSGAIFGLIGVNFIIISSKKKFLLLFILFFIIIALLYLSLAPNMTIQGRLIPNERKIIFWAHLFGFIGGLIFGYLFGIRGRKIRFLKSLKIS